MPDLNDFYAFKNTTEGGANNSGCSGGGLVWIVVIIAIVYIIGKLG